MSLSEGSKTSFLLTLQASSPRCTNELMVGVGIQVDEIVSTYDQIHDVGYAYIHMARGITQEKMMLAMEQGKLSNPSPVDSVQSSMYSSCCILLWSKVVHR